MAKKKTIKMKTKPKHKRQSLNKTYVTYYTNAAIF